MAMARSTAVVSGAAKRLEGRRTVAEGTAVGSGVTGLSAAVAVGEGSVVGVETAVAAASAVGVGKTWVGFTASALPGVVVAVGGSTKVGAARLSPLVAVLPTRIIKTTARPAPSRLRALAVTRVFAVRFVADSWGCLFGAMAGGVGCWAG